MGQTLLVATGNRGKVSEYADMLSDLAISWISLKEIAMNIEVAEIGLTFEENAIIKATEYAERTGYLTLADDSGLEVDALDGRPGVLTARYGGAELSPRDRYMLLLKELAGVPWDKRTARFRCVVALAQPGELIGTASGSCEGLIGLEPVGSGGFGYDPVFYLADKGFTMAQIDPAEKHAISHRGRALSSIVPLLRGTLD
jgi:XTP/dITP diphosphohydrolase